MVLVGGFGRAALMDTHADEQPAYSGVWNDESDHGYKTLLSDLGMECLDPVRCINHYMLF
ncbi:MAG: hypothetical protein OXI96_06200 [Acidimicrobiaceae bacterium]|nr:hypothetical protein [Acidimicrobiaceae bacterium]